MVSQKSAYVCPLSTIVKKYWSVDCAQLVDKPKPISSPHRTTIAADYDENQLAHNDPSSNERQTLSWPRLIDKSLVKLFLEVLSNRTSFLALEILYWFNFYEWQLHLV